MNNADNNNRNNSNNKFIALWSPKHGVGTTSITVMLASYLSRTREHDIFIVDCGGNDAFHMTSLREPAMNIRNWSTCNSPPKITDASVQHYSLPNLKIAPISTGSIDQDVPFVNELSILDSVVDNSIILIDLGCLQQRLAQEYINVLDFVNYSVLVVSLEYAPLKRLFELNKYIDISKDGKRIDCCFAIGQIPTPTPILTADDVSTVSDIKNVISFAFNPNVSLSASAGIIATTTIATYDNKFKHFTDLVDLDIVNEQGVYMQNIRDMLNSS